MFLIIIALFADLFSADYKAVYYWGQNSAGAAGVGTQTRLRDYCTDDVDIIIVSFLIEFGRGFPYVINVANQGDPEAGAELFPGTELLHCPQIGEDIPYCQSLGKKILLSLGGASGAYGFTSDAEARTVANDIRNIFGNGTTQNRPFDKAVMDGYDLDIEGGSSTGYAAFVDEMKRIEPGVLIGAAPQCVYPDAYLQPALDNANIDFAFVQFYNNWCWPGSVFNYDEWDNWAKTKAKNRNIKIFLGTPGSPSAGGGYLGPSDLPQVVDACKRYDTFGGIMMWDASQAFSNTEGGQSYAHLAKSLLK